MTVKEIIAELNAIRLERPIGNLSVLVVPGDGVQRARAYPGRARRQAAAPGVQQALAIRDVDFVQELNAICIRTGADTLE